MRKRRVLLACVTAHVAVWSAPTFAADVEGRQLIDMPLEARVELRAEMLDFQTALHQIVTALAENKFVDAAEIAESRIGQSAMGRHRDAPPNARPGMFMPRDMHMIARGMHLAATDFAKVAKSTRKGKGDPTKALVALQAVTGACVACHRSYRTQ